MSKPLKTLFAGVNADSNAQVPGWYKAVNRIGEPTSFSDAVRSLPRAVETEVAYRNTFTDQWVSTDRFNAIVEPSRLFHQAEGESGLDPLFHVPTDSYVIINPIDIYGPLEEVLREETIDDTDLGDIVFGEIRRYRGGGEVHMDILFDGLFVELPGQDESITIGVSSGYDFFGGHAVYVEGFARNGYCSNTIRRLTERKSIKHIGEIGDFRDWWSNILDQLDFLADDLKAIIEEATDVTIDFRGMPFGIRDFYELLGFPEYLAERASNDVRAEAIDPFDIDLWTLHSGATYALTHHFKGKEGQSLDQYVRVANDLLFNPRASVDRIESEYDTWIEEQDHLDGSKDRAKIERVSKTVRERADQFEARERMLRERFQ